MTSFADTGLSAAALDAVARLGYDEPTPVQEQAIPLVLEGRDIIAAAKTGTGKTAAFSLPALDRTGRARRPKHPVVLVVTPTRELANQIAEVCTAIAAGDGRRVTCVVGGVAQGPQEQRLAKGTDVLIATPGRLLDLMGQQAVSLEDVEVLVLDEADRMLDMGFLPSVRRIVAATPADRQTLLFSATIDESVRRQVDSLLSDPAVVQIASVGETADTVEQFIYRVPKSLRMDLLRAVLADHGHERVIVFVRTRRRADSTCRKLKKMGFTAEALHSDRSQNQRDRALRNFAKGDTDILVATDVLARGIDVDEVAYVVNFDLPTVPEDYVHRIGRTGRAGNEGFALSFVIPETEGELAAIEKLTKRSIPSLDVPSFDVEQAAAEAAARATGAAARKDPELAQAAKEMRARERKKAKAREAAAEKAEQPPAGKGARRGAKKGGSPAGPAAQRASQGRGAKPAGSRGGSSAKGDLRPGRAHRAAVAQQRRTRGERSGRR
ncbi:MAG: DEAD/DEAH box helicase [Eggerthellaceae bacterium]|nr:DEAD/DEAH box helicase [Eggerthellaceae bacterium]